MSGCHMRTNAAPVATAATPIAGAGGGVAHAAPGARMPAAVTNSQQATSYDPSESAADLGGTTGPDAATVAAAASGGGGATGAWNGGWQRAFEALSLTPADIDYLKTGNFTESQLAAIADELAQVPAVAAPAASSGTPATSAPVATDGSTATAPTSSAPSAGTGTAAPGWNAAWQRRFTELKLDPADIQFLSTSGFSDAQLQEVADELAKQPILDPNAPSTSSPSGTGTSGATPGNDPGAPNVTPGAQPGSATPQSSAPAAAPGWNASWEKKFTDIFTKLGVKGSDLTKQLAEVKAAGLSEDQLKQVYDGMNAQAGDWSPKWESKFRSMLTELKVPADQADQVIAGLAQRGLKEADLQKFYDQMVAQKPGWNASWESKFKTLDLPDEMLKSLKESGAPESALKENFDKLLKLKLDALHNGRLKKLDEAGATAEQKWGVFMGNVSDADFDKAVDSIHSANVPLWKRGLSMALNFIPGVGALEYLTGSDWITGDKIDRTNPLNIGMAILSAIPAVSYIKGAAQAVKGATMLGSALRVGAAGTEAAVVGAGAVNTAATIAGDSSKLATMLNAVRGGGVAAEAAGIGTKTATSLMRFGAEGLSTGDKLKHALDIVKMVTPGINRFGTGAELFQLGKGYYQLSGFAAQFGTQLKNLESLGSEGDRLLKNLPSLSKVTEGDLAAKMAKLTAEGKEGTKAFQIAERQLADLKKITEVTGLKPDQIRTIAGKVMPALEGQGTAFRASGKMWHLNPTSSQATASLEGAAEGGGLVSRATGAITGTAGTAGMDSVKLGRGISASATGMGTADFANVASALTGERIGQLGMQLGVTEGKGFRALAQVRRVILPGSEQKILSDVSAMNHADSTLYNGMRWAGNALNKNAIAPSIGMLGLGVVSGQTRQVAQPMWDYWKDRDARNAAEAQLKAEAERRFNEEQAQLDAAQAQMATDNGGATPAVDPAATGGAPSATGVDPAAGAVDPAAGAGSGAPAGTAPAGTNQLQDITG